MARGSEALLRDVGSGISQLSLSTDSLLGLSHQKRSLKEGFGARSLDHFLLGSQAACPLGFFTPQESALNICSLYPPAQGLV